jgi:gluconolactonase
MSDISRRVMMTTGLSLAGMAGFSPSAFSQGPTTGPAPTAYVERLDPSLDALIDANAPVEVIMDGFQWAEGPVWIGGPDGYLLASDRRQRMAAAVRLSGPAYAAPA